MTHIAGAGFPRPPNMQMDAHLQARGKETSSLRNVQPPGWWKPVALISVIIAVMILAKVFGLGQRLEMLRDWIHGLGSWGMVIFVLIYVVGVVAALPGSALTVAAGALFGSVWGVILVSIAATMGASLSFLIARYFARETAARWLSTKENFRKLDTLTRERGAIIVALTRLVPIFPFNLLNYGFGLTQVPFKTYVFWSWLCMLPASALLHSNCQLST